VAKTALIVDDEPDLADGCERLLKEIGLESQLAFRVEDAILFLRTHHPALVLSDINFRNGKDGFALARYVRQSSPRTPVILMSGSSACETEEQAREAGASRFLHKPFTHEELISAVLVVLHCQEQPHERDLRSPCKTTNWPANGQRNGLK
jgi:DNA-binding NtrC family response regulator